MADRMMNRGFQGAMQSYNMHIDTKTDLPASIVGEMRDRIKRKIELIIMRKNSCKFGLSFNITYNKPNTGENVNHWINGVGIVYNTQQIDEVLTKVLGVMYDRVFHDELHGSSWQYMQMNKLYLNLYTFNPLAGRGRLPADRSNSSREAWRRLSEPLPSYVKLPKYIANKQACINVNNNDNKCGMWAVISCVYNSQIDAKHPDRITQYKRKDWIDSFNWTGIAFPMTITAWDTFEKHNTGYLINVYTLSVDSSPECDIVPDNHKIIPLRVGKSTVFNPTVKHIDLLLYREHYVWIKNLSALLAGRTGNDHAVHVCRFCLHCFVRADLLETHLPYCMTFGEQRREMPKPNTTLKFKNVHKQQRVPFIIYGDFESICETIEQETETHTDKKSCSSFTKKLTQHKPSGYCLLMINSITREIVSEKLCTGTDDVSIMESFYDDLEDMQNVACKILKDGQKPPVLTAVQEKAFKLSRTCYFCNNGFTEDDFKVRDHCHISGEYRGPAHRSCNVKYRLSMRVPVVFHNLRGYDSHHILHYYKGDGAGRSPEGSTATHKSTRFSAIVQNTEKFMSFGIDNVRFIDSFQFMSASLDSLVANLSKSGSEAFHYLKQMKINEEVIDVKDFTRKGVYPYSYMDNYDKLDEESLPPIGSFRNDLNESECDESDYEYARQMWTKYKCRFMSDYHDLYLKSDVYLLADVFESFRDVSLKNYKLDPAHYITTPNMCMDALMIKTGVELELITDPTMYDIFESQIRGGVCVASKRHAVANHKYLHNYDPSKPSKYIVYTDMNNMYGYGMRRFLPCSDFKFVESLELFTSEFIMSLGDEDPTGYVLECDIDYPESLHDAHSDFPMLPENMKISESQLSDYQKEIFTGANGKIQLGDAHKLVPNLYNKRNYIIHYRLLKFALNHGLKLVKVHKVIQFKQSPVMRDYIDFNTSQRAKSKNEFEKNYYKLMNNSAFGKTLEDVRKRVKTKMITTEKQMMRATAKPTFQKHIEINENLAMCIEKPAKIKLEKPIYLGGAILDDSKLALYEFHYDYMKVKYGERARVVYTDTDSLVYEIETDDFYEDIKYDLSRWWDTSDYPMTHPLQSDENKKIIGKIKDECNGAHITSFIALKPKMYSYEIQDEKRAHNKGKGIKSHVVKNLIHEVYEQVLHGEIKNYASFKTLRSYNHVIHTIEQRKIGLSNCDSKRYLIDAIDSLPFGHYKIKK